MNEQQNNQKRGIPLIMLIVIVVVIIVGIVFFVSWQTKQEIKEQTPKVNTTKVETQVTTNTKKKTNTAINNNTYN